jgi:multisubunit Na+/H+ antiporter MnhG subunit
MKMINKSDGVSKTQCVEFGLLLTLGVLLLALTQGDKVFVQAAIAFVLIAMSAPMAFYPLAYVWFALARVLGRIGPAILLSVVFFLVVTPVGMLRRLLRTDALHKRKFRQDKVSAMITRNHTYSTGDFQRMF